MNFNLSYHDIIQKNLKRYGLKQAQRVGNIVVRNEFQDHLESMIHKHYTANDYQDADQSRLELKNMFIKSISSMIRKEMKQNPKLF